MRTGEDLAPFLEAFRGRSGIDGEPKWLSALRDGAMRRFTELGFPKRNQEAWRFSDLRPLTASPILPLPLQSGSLDESGLAPFRLAGPTHRVVLVNGRFAPDLSDIGGLPAGVWLGSSAEAARTKPALVEAAFDNSEVSGAQPFASLNAAFFADGFVLAVDAGVTVETPIEIIHVSQGSSAGAFHLRNAIIAGANSQVSIFETAAGSGASWTNAVTSISIGNSARVRHVKLQIEAAKAIHTAILRATLAAKATFESFNLILGGRLSRQDIHVAMVGEGANLAVNGAYLLRGDQEATFAPYVDHQAPGCQTNEVVKGVMQDRAHGVFLGTMAVRPGADQTDANQLNRNLLLSPQATVDTKPELEILADDVKCSHGATVGNLDEAALFYLVARGIKEPTARHMLIEAFAADVIDSADLGDTFSTQLRRYLQIWLDGPGSGV